MGDATGLAEALLGLDGFCVLEVTETAAEVVIRVETAGGLIGFPGCGSVAVVHDRMVVELRDLPVFGRPTRLVWHKRRYRCREPLCEIRTWTETAAAVSSRCLLTRRAGWEACRQVGRNVVRGNTSRDLGLWLDAQPKPWLDGIRVVATDLADSYRVGLTGRLDHALRVADPFHVVRVANRCLDKVRRRVQNQTTGHRGRKRDPLYRIRKLLLKGAERLDGTGLDRML